MLILFQKRLKSNNKVTNIQSKITKTKIQSNKTAAVKSIDY